VGDEIFSPGAHPTSYTMGIGTFPGIKRLRRSVDHPPPTSAEVVERVELYLHSPSGPSWSVLRRTLLYLYLQLRLEIYRTNIPYKIVIL